MPNKLKNWTYRDVINFLECKGFGFYEQLDHAQSWAKLSDDGQSDKFVPIKYTEGIYSPAALSKMVRLSGIPENEWIKWAQSKASIPNMRFEHFNGTFELTVDGPDQIFLFDLEDSNFLHVPQHS